MLMIRSSVLAMCALVIVLVQPDVGRAQSGPAPEPRQAQARELFVRGAERVKAAQWAEALSEFEQSNAILAHATTQLNMGICNRSLGRYTRARADFEAALARAAANPSELAGTLADDARAHIAQIDGLLARVSITLEPPDTAIAIDGRGLTVRVYQGARALVAGLGPVGPPVTVEAPVFLLELDPGPHVFTLRRTGFGDAIVNRVFAPGVRGDLPIRLEQLPATLRIRANVEGAVAAVDDKDMGPPPVDVLRPGGSYDVTVTRKGYLPYRLRVAPKPGELLELHAVLVEDKPALTSRWWFWTVAATVVAGGVITTYALTRPAPTPPPYDAGNTGWLVQSLR
jgi:hypothetical protein